MRRILLILALSTAAFAATQHDPWGAVITPTANCPVPRAGGNFTVNTTSTTAVTVVPGNTVITPASMTGILNGMFLLADPCQAPVTVSNEVIATGNGATKDYTATLAHDTVIPGSLTITTTTSGGAITVTEDNNFNSIFYGRGLIGSGGGGLACATATPCLHTTLLNKSPNGDSSGNDSEWVTIHFTNNVNNATSVLASYQYIPSEVCQISAVTGSTFTCNFRNTHSSGFTIWPGYPMTGKITDGSTQLQRWVLISPLSGYPAYFRGLWETGITNPYVAYANTLGGHLMTPSSVDTTFNGSCASGQPTCTLASVTNITSAAGAGQKLRLSPGVGTAELLTVLSVNAGAKTVTFTSNLANTHATGDHVVCCTSDDIIKGRYGNADLTGGPAELGRLAQYGFNEVAPDSFQYYFPDRNISTYVPNPPDHYNPMKMPGMRESFSEFYTPWNWEGYMNTNTTGSNGVKDLVYAEDPGYGSTFFTDAYLGSQQIDVFDPGMIQYWNGELPDEVAGLQSPWFIGNKPLETDGYDCITAGEDFPTIKSGHNSPHCAIQTLSSAPIICGQPAGSHQTRYTQAYADCTNNTKTNFKNALITEYTTAAALNTAWGGSTPYTQFTSTGTQVNGESCDTTNGSKTTFTCTTAHFPIDRFSVSVLITPTGLPAYHMAAGMNDDTVKGANDSEVAAHELINTTVVAGIGAGTNTVTPVSMTGIYPGTAVQLDQGVGGADEIVYVTAVGRGSSCAGVSIGASPCVPKTMTFANLNVHGANFTVKRAFNCTTGSINRSTGVFTVTCTAGGGGAIATGYPVTLNYHYNGWGNGGTGFMDENGKGAYLGSTTGSAVYVNHSTLASRAGLVNTAFQTDMNTEMQTEYDKFQGDYENGMRTNVPHTLVVTAYSGGGSWNTPSRPEALKHLASGNPVATDGRGADIVSWSSLNAYPSADLSTRDGGPALNRYSYLLHYAGDIPVINWIGDDANVDSDAAFCLQQSGEPTQLLRTGEFDTAYNDSFTFTHPDNNTLNGIGTQQWSWRDFSNGECTNWGFFNSQDTAYGAQSTTASTTFETLGVTYPTIAGIADWSDGNFSGTLTTRFATIDNALAQNPNTTISIKGMAVSGVTVH